MVSKSEPVDSVIKEFLRMMASAGVPENSVDITFRLMVESYCMGGRSGVDLVFEQLDQASKKHAERN